MPPLSTRPTEPTEWLNYHHLLYFWVVAREGGVTRAAKVLRVAQPTVSGQVKALEEAFGEKLFARVGRNIQLTEIGRTVFQYAEEIFALGRELRNALHGLPSSARPARFVVGVGAAVPKLLSYQILAPAFAQTPSLHVVYRQDRLERLMTELGAHELDLVVSDSPASTGTGVKAYSHLLLECGVTFFAPVRLAATYRKDFPGCLHGAPFLLPTDTAALRNPLLQWFDDRGLRPRYVAECDDSALLKALGQAGVGLFAAPSSIAREIARQYRVRAIGSVPELRERYYALSLERRNKNPIVLAIAQNAQRRLEGH